jgi:putative MATE family efflux protein
MTNALMQGSTTPSAADALAPRTRALLVSPVLPTLLRLSTPDLAEAAARIIFLTTDALFVSWLGSEALAAVAVVFPFQLLVQTATASGFGAGVSSSIGHALGGGCRGRADDLAGAAAALALVASVVTAATLLLAGPWLYHAMGASGRSLTLATRYGGVLFSGIAFVWLMNTFANIARGSGNMLVPASGIFLGEACHLLLSPALILGWGPFPRLGITGAALGTLSSYALGTGIIGAYLCAPQALVRIELRRIAVRRDTAWRILRIAAPAAASVLVFYSVNLLTLFLIGRLGTAVIAGYGVASRLETLQYPILFAFGSSVVAMVATAIGAGDRRRAAHVAWTGCAVATLVALAFAAVGLSGDVWIRPFTSDPAIRAAGALYLHWLAPLFPLLAAGIAGATACYAMALAKAPLIASVGRLSIVTGAGWLALTVSGRPGSVFAALALGAGTYGLIILYILQRRLHGAGRDAHADATGGQPATTRGRVR